MTMLITTWILWAIIETVNPNVSGFVTVNEFTTQEKCVSLIHAMAKQGVPVPPQSGITAVVLSCIPVATRISEHAH